MKSLSIQQRLGGWITALILISATPQAHAVVTVDGTRNAGTETEYAERAVQATTTNWGSGNALANLHTAQVGSDLSIFIGGKAQTNAIILFIDSKAGGPSFIPNNQITTGGEENTINNLGSSPTAGLTFETGFNPDYAIRIYGDATSTGAFVNRYDLQTGSRSYVGESVTSSPSASGFIKEIRTIWTDVSAPLSGVVNGVEMKLSLAALGVPTGTQTVKLMAILVNGDSSYGSNQVLASRTSSNADIGTGINAIDFQAESGTQTLSIPVTGPPPRDVTFSVNMNDEIAKGNFIPGSSTTKVLFFTGVASPAPGQLILTDPDADGIYTGSLSVTGAEGSAFGQYKFFNTKPGAPNFGYEYGDDRNFNLGPDGTTQTLPTVTFRPNSYSLWAGYFVGGQSGNQDYDGDGLKNSVEYFMGQTGASFTANPQVVAGVISWPHDPAAIGVTYKVESSEDLIHWTNVTLNASDSGGFLTYTLPTSTPTLFVRLVVETP